VEEEMRETILLFAALALAGPAFAQPSEGEKTLYLDDDSTVRTRPVQPVRLRNVTMTADGAVSGTLVNGLSDVIRDVRLLVNYVWIWQDERNPGEDSPGRSSYHSISGDVPAFGTLDFTYVPSSRLPDRTDGNFVPSIEVASYTRIKYVKKRRKVEH
jgi:hypothetical protein